MKLTNTELKREVLRYEKKYFKDLTLRERSLREKLKFVWEIAIPELSLKRWKFKISPKEALPFNAAGWADINTRTLHIHKTLVNERVRRREILLHEMVHAYEYELNELNEPGEYYGFVKQSLILYLLSKIKRQIGERDTNALVEVITDSSFWVNGHTPLFILKTIDLDIKLKYDWLTLFGYYENPFGDGGLYPGFDHKEIIKRSRRERG